MSRNAERAAGGWPATGGYPPGPYQPGGYPGVGYPGGAPASPPQGPRKLILGVVGGLLVGALLAGTVGYLVGANTGEDRPGDATSSPAPGGLRPYESAQLAINKEKFSGDLAVLAERWLPWVSGCAANTDEGGPQLPADEKVHVFCRYGDVSAHFAEYSSAGTRDAARAYRYRLNLDAADLAPGMEKPARKRGGSSNASGNYVEYAFRGSDKQPLCGIWWDRDDSTSAAFYLETLCQQDLGGKWEPLRDLWQRYS